MRNSRYSTIRITLVGMMAALCFVSNYIRIPLLGSQVHIGNAVCVLCGFLFGPWFGFISAGIGNMLYDLMAGYGYECLITLVSKGAIAAVAGAIAHKAALGDKPDTARVFVGAGLGALTYVALYMLKTFIFGLTVRGLGMDGTIASMISKLPASLINAGFAFIVAPIFWHALHPALRHTGILEKL